MSATDSHLRSKHNDLWFLDGDMILSACTDTHSGGGPAQDHPQILFRVHKSLVCSHCIVFKDILGIPAAKGANQEIEGTPVVHLPDSASHLADFLGVIYGQRSLLPPDLKGSMNPALELLHIIRLAAKYQAERILTDALHMIHPHWPKDLEGWDWWDDEIRMRKVPFVCDTRPWLDDLLPEPISTMLISQRHDFAGILRAALYQLYRTSILSDRQERLSDPNWVQSHYELRYSFSANWSLLEKPELIRVFRAKEKIDRVAVEEASAIFRPHIVENNHADIPDECWPACQAVRSRYLDNFAFTKDVLFALRQIGNRAIMQGMFGMCNDCAIHIEERAVQLRNDIWNTLPDHYGINH